MSQGQLEGTEKKEKFEDITLERPKPIKGYPELVWAGKRPFTKVRYYPAQKLEQQGIGDPVDGWMNQIYWGDNIQVLSHLLEDFRGKIDLVYIDPPFAANADFKKKIELRKGKKNKENKGTEITNDIALFEEIQYRDIWAHDEYLQYMYERLILIRELLSDKGSIFLHCDWHKASALSQILNEIFGVHNFINEIIWCYYGPGSPEMHQFNRKHDNIYWYSKNGKWIFNEDAIKEAHNPKTKANFKGGLQGSGFIVEDYDLEEGKVPEDWWPLAIAARFPKDGIRYTGYPTEKSYKLLERIIKTASNPGSIVLDCFMGSGTTQAVAMKLGRKFIGADINLGAVETTTKRLTRIINEKKVEGIIRLENGDPLYLNFERYTINNYEIFKNEPEAKKLLLDALQVDPDSQVGIFDATKDSFYVKIMPINRIATVTDLGEIVAKIDRRELQKKYEENPVGTHGKIMLVCMGHEPDLKAKLETAIHPYTLEVEVVDILKDKDWKLQFKREPEADISLKENRLIINDFFPRNLMDKLGKGNIPEDWKELVDSVYIDYNYDGKVFRPQIPDTPPRYEQVKGEYELPENHGDVRIRITDLLSESLEVTVREESNG